MIPQLISNNPEPYTLLLYTPILHPNPYFLKSSPLNFNPSTLSPDPWNPCAQVNYKYSLIIHQLTANNPFSWSAINCSWTIDNCNWIPATHMWDKTHIWVTLNTAITPNSAPYTNNQNFLTPQTLNLNRLSSNWPAMTRALESWPWLISPHAHPR